MKRRVGILLFDEVEVLDFAGPFEVFSRTRTVPGVESRRNTDSAPFEVLTVARTRAPITATGGLIVQPSHGFGDASELEVLVIPGGFGTRALLHDAPTLEWIQRVVAGAELVTSVCTGALLLAKLGVLANRRATTHWAALDLLASLDASMTVERGARYVDEGRVVTSAGVAAGMDMAFHVVARLCGIEVATETARYIEYPWRA